MTTELFLIEEEHSTAMTLKHLPTVLKDSVIIHQYVKRRYVGFLRVLQQMSKVRQSLGCLRGDFADSVGSSLVARTASQVSDNRTC